MTIYNCTKRDSKTETLKINVTFIFLFSPVLGHSERAMLYYELEDGLYTAGPYFFTKVTGQG